MADFQPAAPAAVGDSCSAFGPAVQADSSRLGPVDRRERPASAPLVEFSAYKATRLSDIVCRRTVRLFSDDRVTTVHPSSGDLPGSEKTWFLDRTCSLQPEYVQELVAEKRTVRPPGQWTVTAKLHTVVSSQAQEPIDLYCVTIHWPTSWLATRGYTSFTLGFETIERAAQWHALVQRQLSMLRVRAASSKGDSSTGHSSKPSYDEGLGSRAAGSGNGTVGRKTSQGFVAAALEHFWSSGSGLKDDKQLRLGLDGCDQGHTGSRHVPANGHGSPPALLQELRSNGHLHNGQHHHQHMPPSYPDMSEAVQVLPVEGEGSFTSSSTDVIDGTAQLLQPGFGAGGQQDEQRWVPYRHTNGVAIYHHKESAATCCLWSCGQDEDAGGEPPGSEYMASSIVRGCPDECLSVLVELSSNTTILGPASKIELLEDGQERQVLRLTVEATGMARRLCAPREVIVERLFKREECGVDVILFSSCEEPPVAHSASGIKRQQRATAAASAGSSCAGRASAAGAHASGSNASSSRKPGSAVDPVVAAAAVAAAGVAAAVAGTWLGCIALLLVAVVTLLCWPRLSGSRRRFQSLWYKPVRAYVQGGYTISPREDCNAINSPECLVTCILKVDLRGFLGERSWLRPILDALGWVDAYVERMLMAVILVKDEVEQQRFLVQPFSILTNNHAARASSSMATATSAAGSSAADADELQEANNLREGYSQHLRQQQLMRQRRRQLALQQQQQQAAYMQHKAAQAAGFIPADEAARLAAHGYWGSGVTASQAGLLRSGMYATQQGAAAAGQFTPDYNMPWLYKGPLSDAGAEGSGYGGQQQEMQGAEGGPQLKRGSSQGRQQGRLGRMASRIYSLRPRLRKGDSSSDRAPASAASGAAGSGTAGAGAAGLYTQVGASFRNGLSALGAADAAASAAPTAAGGAVGVAAAGAADAAAGAVDAAATAQAAAAAAEAAGGVVPLDLTNTPAVLKSVGLPTDTPVVGPQYYIGGPTGPAAKCSSLNHRYWSELHVPGTPAPFKLRGASYLADRTKVDGGMPQFVLGSVDLVETAGPTQHISRFLPAVRCNEAAYSFVVNLIIPGTPVLSLVAVFINEHHPDILDGPSCSSGSGHTAASHSTPALASREQEQQQHSTLRRLRSSSTSNLPDAADLAAGAEQQLTGSDGADGAFGGPSSSHSHYATPVGNSRPVDAISEGSGSGASPGGGGAGGNDAAGRDDGDAAAAAAYQRPCDVNDWQPFDFVLHRFLHGGPATRQAMFKLIPHIAEGSWVIKQSVGTVPVILGNKLQTVYYQTDRYIEATVDVTSSSAAAYITSMVRGATKSLVIDLGFVLEGQRPEELPEAMLGAFRLNHLDCSQAKRIDTTHELPLLPRPLQQHQLAQMAAAAAAAGAASLAGGGAAAAAAVANGSAATEAVAAAGFGVGGGQLDQQRRVCSASGAMPAVSVAAAAADRAALQQQQQQQQRGAVQQQGPARPSSHARNSASVLESGRTMTGHARSRSAASADELYLNQEPLLLAEAVHNSREQRLQQQQQQAGDAQQQQQQQQPAREPSGSSNGSGACAPQPPAAPAASGSSAACPAPPSIKTSAGQFDEAGSAAAEGVFAAAAAAGGGSGGVATQGSAASGGVPSATRQLFGSLLPFGSSSGFSSSQQDKSAGKAANGSNASLSACGAVTNLLGSSTPTAAGAAAAAQNLASSSPRNPAAGNSSNSLLVNTGLAAHGGGGGSHHHYHRSSLISTPTAAAAAAAAAVSGVTGTPGSSIHSGHHHRTSSGLSDAASRTPATGWPASPPAPGQDISATKLSAAAFISRAHAAALAASAQRRGQRTIPSASGGVCGSPAGFNSFGSPAAASQGGEHSYAGSPGAATSLSAAVAAGGTGSNADPDGPQAGVGWPIRRPRASSSGIPEAERQSLEHFSSLPAPQQQLLQSADGGLGSCGSCGKISASEQLRLTHSALRASATGGGGGGLQLAGQHPGGGGSLQGGSSNARQSSTSGGLGAGEAGGIGQLIGTGVEQPAQGVKGRVSSHRRFASMSAMQ